jgi:hypothetical protein
MGPPRHGLLSVVVTDIQDYTRLTNEAPDEMGQVWDSIRGAVACLHGVIEAASVGGRCWRRP